MVKKETTYAILNYLSELGILLLITTVFKNNMANR